LEDFSHQQIAEILGIRAGTVKSRIYYAKQSLRKELEKNHG
jgi:DNA-directed RNA polymerase specialized sigma24 family protein